MSNSRAVRAAPFMIFAAMFAVYISVRGCAALNRKVQVHPRMQQVRWPNPFMLNMADRATATPAQRRFAIAVAKAQMNSFETGVYNGTAMDEGRFVNSFQPPGPVYFQFMRHDALPLAYWRRAKFGEAMVTRDDGGIWLVVEPHAAHGRTSSLLFYANPHYAPHPH